MDALALLVVDVQSALIELIPNGGEILKRTAFSVEASNLLEIQCLYSEQVPEKLKSTSSILLEAGLKEAPCFHKNTFSALQSPGLIEHLNAKGIEHLLIAGIELPICIYQTAMDAVKAGFEVTLLSDCIGARRSQDAQAIICALQKTKVHWLPSEAVFYSILGSAEHPDFRAFTQLVKKYQSTEVK